MYMYVPEVKREAEGCGPDGESDGVDEGGKEVGMGGTEVVSSTELDGWGSVDMVDTNWLTPPVRENKHLENKQLVMTLYTWYIFTVIY